jgi:hypothetical protein
MNESADEDASSFTSEVVTPETMPWVLEVTREWLEANPDSDEIVEQMERSKARWLEEMAEEAAAEKEK